MEEKSKDNYAVYAHRSKLDGKLYIGATRQKLSKRFLNGAGYEHCKRFWDAIQEQGFSNFDHIVIAEGLSREKAMRMEEVLIDILGTMNPNVGYNMRNGGEHNIPCEEIKQKISKAQMGHSVSKELIKKQKKLFGKPVIQLTEDGEFIAVFISLHEAARNVKGKIANISAACHGKAATSYGYKWCFLSETNGEYNEQIINTGIMQDERCGEAFMREWSKIVGNGGTQK